MNKKYYYLLSLILVFVLPAIIAGYYVWERISLSHLISFVLLITVIGTLWDIWATRHGKRDPVWLWCFNPKETLGIKFLSLPIEEYLFYISSSVYIVFVWEVIRLAIDSGSWLHYLMIPALGIWTLASISIPYFLTSKHDKLFD